MTPRENLNNWQNDPRNIAHQIIRVTWNWYYTTDSDYGEEYKSAEVGKNGVAKIEALASDGIPGVYRVTLEPDSEGVVYTTTIYNPCEVVEELRHIGPDPKAKPEKETEFAPEENPADSMNGISLWALHKKAEYLAKQTKGTYEHFTFPMYSEIRVGGFTFGLSVTDPRQLLVIAPGGEEQGKTPEMTAEEMVLFINTTVGR